MFKIVLFLCFSVTVIKCLTDCRRFKRQSLQHQCELTTQSTEGPFYVSPAIIRNNITDYRPGIPFRLTLTFTNAKNCLPLPGLWITTWHCDAIGYYSHYTKINPTVTFPADVINHATPTDGSQFLRGIQMTDFNGQVTFDTLLPGWYANRTRHIHYKIYRATRAMFTGQLYFTEQQSDWLYGEYPYYSTKRVFNSYDYLYTDFDGKQNTITDIQPVTRKRPNDGFVGKIGIGLYLNSTDFGANGLV